MLLGGQLSQLFVASISVKLIVLIPRMQCTLCAIIWCLLSVVLQILGYVCLRLCRSFTG
jgi:hypothetical protein